MYGSPGRVRMSKDFNDQLQKDGNVASISDAVNKAAPVKRKKKADKSDLPDGCPVTPLGRKEDMFFYMDANRQLQSLRADKHGHLFLKNLFAPNTEFCEVHWPRYGKSQNDEPPPIVGTDWSKVSDALMNACARIGPIDLQSRVRAAGAWLGGDGRLMMHCGDRIYCGDGSGHLPGRIGEHIYPAAGQIPQPLERDEGVGAAEEVMQALKSWNWARPDIDPHLMLGWIGAAMIGGALDWRPLIWLTGDKATGKSTLQKMVKLIMTEAGLIYSADATEASIRQQIGRASLPVAVDELEAEEDNRRQNNIVKLARVACSGSQVLRGGADHKGVAFTMNSCFMFSSILIPPMLGQDVSRMAILELNRLDDVMAPTLKPDHYKHIGQVFKRQFLDRWSDFQVNLEKYRAALARHGHTGRSADQFGTLYACHDLLIYDGVSEDGTIEDVARRLAYHSLAEATEDVADWERCIAHLMSCQLDYYRGGERKSVGAWVMQAAGMERGADKTDIDDANKALANYGMRVHRHVVSREHSYYVLRVANSHKGMNELFRDTHWAGRSGTSGVWVQSMRRVPDAIIGKKPTTFNGVMQRYTEIPVGKILQNDDEDVRGGNNAFAS